MVSVALHFEASGVHQTTLLFLRAAAKSRLPVHAAYWQQPATMGLGPGTAGHASTLHSVDQLGTMEALVQAGQEQEFQMLGMAPSGVHS